MTQYLLDANVFIQAKNFYYGFDICPGFWDWLDHVVPLGTAHSITRVCDELTDGNDELAQWVKARKHDGRFLDITDAATQSVFRDVAAAVQAGSYTEAAKAKFLGGADPWLVAKAKTAGAVVVTHEKPAADAKARVPLPNVCIAAGVAYIDTFHLLRGQAASFGLTLV